MTTSVQQLTSALNAQHWLDDVMTDDSPKGLVRAMLTVVAQAEQIAAVLALHTGHHWCMNNDRTEVYTYGFGTLGPCPTARALGVIA